MYILRYNTDSTIKVGPLVSAGDGVTLMTGMGYDLSAARLTKNSNTFATRSNYINLSATHDSVQSGYFNLPISATDLLTYGNLRVAYSGPNCVPLQEDCWVMSTAAYDSNFGASAINVNLATWLGVAPNALNNGLVESTMMRLNGSISNLEKFTYGVSHVLSATVTSASFAPTTSTFDVSGIPVLGNVNNLNNRTLYWRTGVLNEFKTNIFSLADQGGGVYRVTITPSAPTLPVNSDRIDII